MARPHREQIAGGAYHVTSRGNRRQSIYHDDDDRKQFLVLRDRVVRHCGWRMLAYCLMTNHFHLLIETSVPNLSAGMHRLNSSYAKYFNERHSVDGHLFDRRFGSRLIETEDQLNDTLRYIAFNPVEAGLCAHPREWRWSSFFGLGHSFLFER
jgi:REP element-mobilizing transposase RayT